MYLLNNCYPSSSRPAFRKHLVVLLQVASGSAAVPATAHRRFHVEKKQRRGLAVILPETIVRRRCAALIPYARNARTHSDQRIIAGHGRVPRHAKAGRVHAPADRE